MTMTLDGTNGVTFNDASLQGAAASPFGLKNKIINGGMDISQRNTSYTSANSENNDDTYVLDRFYILSDGNDAIDVTQTTTVPTGSKYSIGLDVETINKKFGIAQIIENTNCVDAIGGAVTVSFKAKVSSTTKLDNIKCAIVSWSGTADTVTSDIISAWGAEGTNPTLIANATYENTPVNLNVTTSFATYSVTATVDTASTSNIILFIWSDVTDTTLGDFLYITNVQLEIGSSATPFERKLYNQELANCQRYFLRLGGDSAYTPYGTGNNYSTTRGNMLVTYPVPMRTSPTLTATAPNRVLSGAANNSVTDFALGNGGALGAYIDYTTTGVTQGHGSLITANGSTAGNLSFSAEL